MKKLVVMLLILWAVVFCNCTTSSKLDLVDQSGLIIHVEKIESVLGGKTTYDYVSNSDSIVIVDIYSDKEFRNYEDKICFSYMGKPAEVDGSGDVYLSGNKISHFTDSRSNNLVIDIRSCARKYWQFIFMPNISWAGN